MDYGKPNYQPIVNTLGCFLEKCSYNFLKHMSKNICIDNYLNFQMMQLSMLLLQKLDYKYNALFNAKNYENYLICLNLVFSIN